MTGINYTQFKGEFAKECPCSPDSVSCGYFNLNLHTGCPYECSYCILNSYLETKDPVFFSNIEDAEKQLKILSENEKFIRIGTGELSDSLAFDPGTGISSKIFKLFKEFPEIIFEFKTKSVNIENLLEMDPPRNIVISWSLNPEGTIRAEEPKTPALEERLKAMKRVKEHGYTTGIHFDPILYGDNWKENYRALISRIAHFLKVDDIAWWSLGTLRFPESLLPHIINNRRSNLLKGELIGTDGGKYRYFRPLRTKMYKFVRDEIRESFGEDVPLYLCMETERVWKDVFPEAEPKRSIINEKLYKRVMNDLLPVS